MHLQTAYNHMGSAKVVGLVAFSETVEPSSVVCGRGSEPKVGWNQSAVGDDPRLHSSVLFKLMNGER
jgi:hypothetical protein